MCVVMAAHEMQCHSLPNKILEFYTVQSVEFDMVLNVDAYHQRSNCGKLLHILGLQL
jgi:hypothetical protein